MGSYIRAHVVKTKTTKNGKDDKVINVHCPSEEVAAVIVRLVVDAVVYLHDHNIVYRDLKASVDVNAYAYAYVYAYAYSIFRMSLQCWRFVQILFISISILFYY